MTAVQQRPLRGSRISSFYPVKSLPSLASLDSAFQLQEYISLLIRLDVHDVEAIVTLPGKGSGKEKEKEKERDDEATGDEKPSEEKDGEKDRKTDVAVDEACWIYEQLRRLAQDLSHPLITMLQQECTRASCPEMKAGEWLYLCVAHGNDGAMEQCCAIDYILHTVDSATALLNSPRTFPSRLQIPQTSHRHFSALARRLGRIFAHAYFHHREAFEQAEVESSLYARFLALTSKFDLVPTEFLVIPQHLSHNDGDSRDEVQPPRLLAAAVDPANQNGRNQGEPRDEGPFSDPVWDRRGSVVGPVERAKSHSPPGLGSGSESPRKFGRSRTDTMVLSDVSAVAEDLAKGEEEGPVQRTAVLVSEDVKEIENPSPPSDVSEPSTPLDAVLSESATPGLSLLTVGDPSTPELEESSALASPPETAKPSLPETQKPAEEDPPAPADDLSTSTGAQPEDKNVEPTPTATPASDPAVAESTPPASEATEQEEQEASVTDAPPTATPAAEPSPVPVPSTEPASEPEVADASSSAEPEPAPQPEPAIEATPEVKDELAAELEKHEADIPDSAPPSETVSEAPTAPTSLPETSSDVQPAVNTNPNEEKPASEESVEAPEASATEVIPVDTPMETPVSSENEPGTASDDGPLTAPEPALSDAASPEPSTTIPLTGVEKEKEPEDTLSEGAAVGDPLEVTP